MVNTRHSDTSSSSSSPSKKKETVTKWMNKIQVTAVPRRIQKYAPRANNTKFRKTKSTNEESVQVFKMLTGVLYLYRGQNPRAEFVRKV
ncbi:expressed unknown protein [Seminavis robusta]|uniref:Uncharacterized protein n=1 Tax=Seminavis robusta TaxID=568900 RepID=A0A9N8DM24_9STRA|nr:expressed unknown protein [Seminavis robusta]|eukprot:Sro159_g071870.1 n/a (89) ;mRNA; r:67628-67894